MPSNRLEYDQQYWLEHGHKQTLKVRLAEAEAEIRRLRAALEGVLAEADRKTDAFDRAHAALDRPNCC